MAVNTDGLLWSFIFSECCQGLPGHSKMAAFIYEQALGKSSQQYVHSLWQGGSWNPSTF